MIEMSRKERSAIQYFGDRKISTVADFLFELENSVTNFLKSESLMEVPASWDSSLCQTGYLFQHIQRLILDEMMETDRAKDKEQYIRVMQVTIVRLLDTVSNAASENSWVYQSESIKNLSELLINLLHYLRGYFGIYFDEREKIPIALIGIYKNEIKNLSCEYKALVSEKGQGGSVLIDLIAEHFDVSECLSKPDCTFNHFLYLKELLAAVLKCEELSDYTLRKVLYYFNFNSSSFVIYEFDRLVELVGKLPTKMEKISALRIEYKKMNQVAAKINYAFDGDMPSLKEQVGTWIEEEIRYCEAGHFLQMPVNANGEIENKIHTTLSVAKLSLLIRILVVDKIIVNRTVAPMLKTVSKMFSTLQREEISFGSLETKYHAPDKSTIAVMKEMLRKWIVILGKL